MFSLLAAGLPTHQPCRPLHQRIHQPPHLAREDRNRGIPTPHHKPPILDHNRQVIGHADCICGPEAPFAENGLPDGEVICLAGLDEAIAGVTVLRLLGFSHSCTVPSGMVAPWRDVACTSGSSVAMAPRRSAPHRSPLLPQCQTEAEWAGVLTDMDFRPGQAGAWVICVGNFRILPRTSPCPGSFMGGV